MSVIDIEILTEDLPVAVRRREVGYVTCADCDQHVALYSDGETIRVVHHDACGMGGQPLAVQVRARRLALALRKVQP